MCHFVTKHVLILKKEEKSLCSYKITPFGKSYYHLLFNLTINVLIEQNAMGTVIIVIIC